MVEISNWVLGIGHWVFAIHYSQFPIPHSLFTTPSLQFEGDHQEIVLPFSFVDVIGEVAVKRHQLR